MISRILQSKKICTIKIVVGRVNNMTFVNYTKAINGKGSNVKVDFNPIYDPDILTFDSLIGNVYQCSISEKSGVVRSTQYVRKEELATIGLDFNEKDDITENKIRLEHKVNLRSAY